eukprot:Nk52_evm8s621 gene=Nk52_evmTU8s621
MAQLKKKPQWNNTVQIIPTYSDKQYNLRHVTLEFSKIPPLRNHYNFRDEAIPGVVSSKSMAERSRKVFAKTLEPEWGFQSYFDQKQHDLRHGVLTKQCLETTARKRDKLLSKRTYVNPSAVEAQRTQKLRVFKYHYADQLKSVQSQGGDITKNVKDLLDDIKIKNPLKSEFLVKEEKSGTESNFTIVWADKSKKKKKRKKKFKEYDGSFLC